MSEDEQVTWEDFEKVVARDLKEGNFSRWTDPELLASLDEEELAHITRPLELARRYPREHRMPYMGDEAYYLIMKRWDQINGRTSHRTRMEERRREPEMEVVVEEEEFPYVGRELDPRYEEYLRELRHLEYEERLLRKELKQQLPIGYKRPRVVPRTLSLEEQRKYRRLMDEHGGSHRVIGDAMDRNSYEHRGRVDPILFEDEIQSMREVRAPPVRVPVSPPVSVPVSVAPVRTHRVIDPPFAPVFSREYLKTLAARAANRKARAKKANRDPSIPAVRGRKPKKPK